MPSACRYPEGRTDPDIIATGILSRESQDLLFDSDEFADLSGELERVLELIRDAYPATASIHGRDGRYVPGQIILGVESPLKEAIYKAIASQPTTERLATGQEAFDSLNAELGGVRGVSTSRYMDDWLLLCLDQLVNVRAASEAYAELEGIRDAHPNGMGGDGPDIDALRDGGTWYVVFRDAWGDCPAGCMESKLYYFAVTDDSVTAVEPAQAEADPKFAALARWAHGDEIVGIGVYWAQSPVTGEFVIVAPLVDSTARQAGVRRGDVILAFDGRPTGGWSEDDFIARLGGYEGTEVTLKVRHGDGSEEDISFVRAAVQYPVAVQAERIGVELAGGTATGVLLLRPTPNFRGPAIIRWGDLLLAVNGESTAAWAAVEAADRIDSIPAEHVTLTVQHVEGGIEDITVSTR